MAAMVGVLLLGLLQLAVPGLAQSPPSGTVKIEDTMYAGSGCPPGSLELIISPSGSISLGFPQFTVVTPGEAADRRKNCQVGVTLSYPAGFTYGVGTVAFRGSAQLEEGVKGSLTAAYYFSGVPGTVRLSRKLPPPVDGNFEFSDSFATIGYAPCDIESPKLTLSFEAKVVPPRPPRNNNKGFITVDGLGFSLVWKKC